jgi:hypothetical protein
LRQPELGALEGGEPLAANLAFAAPPDDIAVFGKARVDHAGLVS